MWSSAAIILLALRSALAAPSNNAPLVGETVQTSSGPVSGHEAQWPANSGVSEYLGIPFAEPPLGQLRFAAPQTYKPRGPISGAEFAPGCLQAGDMSDVAEGSASKNVFKKTTNKVEAYGTGMGGHIPSRNYSEDCLALNIWTKPGNKGKAVMIWIYGGAFGTGDTAALFYNGARYAAEQDVVVASINYRVSLFGFPNAPTLPDQNVGLLDQRKGVEWLRDNIEKFGGDPKRMILFGESAGGASVDYYAYAWTKDPIVNGFIPQSGSASMRPKDSKPASESNWYKLTNRLGCGKAKDGAKTVDCMRSLPSLTVLKQVIDWSAVNSNPISTLTQFGPTPDEKLVFSDYAKRQEEGNFIKRPVLIGNMDQEGALFPALTKAMAKSYGASQGGMVATVINGLLGFIDSYQEAPAAPGTPATGLDRMGCGPIAGASARAKAKVPVWRYRFFGLWPNLEIYPGAAAYHSMDCPIVFGATERVSPIPDTPDEALHVKNVMTAWATFAKDPDHGLEKLGWPLYDPKGPTLVRIGYKNNPNFTFSSPSEYDQGCN